jgi:hypothetical protein
VTFLWIAVAVLGALMVWLGLALAGAVRELVTLRQRVEALEARAGAPDHLASGLPPGAPAPPWEALDVDGSPVSSAVFAGHRHLMVFADADCGACDELVPAIVRASTDGSLPPAAVIARAPLDASPPGWRPPDDDPSVIVGVEHGRDISDRYRVDVTPTVFLVDEGGLVVARGNPASLEETRQLVDDTDGVRIVAGPVDG